MHRRALLSAIETYWQRYPGEQATTAQFLNFVNAHDDCFARSLLVGHVTGSAWLSDEAGDHVLLTHHRKLDIWVQLGGHCDGDADTFAVAMREAREESGIAAIEAAQRGIFDLDVHEIPERAAEPAHLHYDVRYALRTKGRPQFRVSAESKALQWVPVAQLHTLTCEASMLRMSEKWRAGQHKD